MPSTKEMPSWVYEKRAKYLSEAKGSEAFLDAIFCIYFYNKYQCHDQLPKIEPEEVFNKKCQQAELDLAYKKCDLLIRSGYKVGETLYKIRSESSEITNIEIEKFKTDNPGFSNSSYQRAMGHGQTAAVF